MNFYLQFGYGMMAHARTLLTQWGDGGVILSPRDLTEAQLKRVSKEALKCGREPLLDPQCYARDADHHRLTQHKYWKVIAARSTGAFSGGPGTAMLLSELASLAKSLGVKRHILPGCLAPAINEDWFMMQESIIEEAPVHFRKDSLFATIALSSSVMSSEEQIEAVVERSRNWAVAGVYIVAETPASYLVDSPSWLTNLLLLASGMKLAGKTVIVGYCNHQTLCLAATGADVMASGTWLNVRAFPPDKFYEPEEDSISRRSVWYYCPQALSEYKVPFLDIAHRVGILDDMRPPSHLGSTYADPLFSGPVPSSINWPETEAHRHYLTSLRAQVRGARKSSFAKTIDALNKELDDAETMLKSMRKSGVLGQDRDFREYIDVNRSALAVYRTAREARMARSW